MKCDKIKKIFKIYMRYFKRFEKGEINVRNILYHIFLKKLRYGFIVQLFKAVDLKNAPCGVTKLNIQTYDKYGQTVHPDVILRKDGKFVLALTPYPFTDATYENPCIYISNDGINFNEPAKGVNPLAKPKKNYKNHLSDCDLAEIDGFICLYYRETLIFEEKDKIYLMKSKDLISWSAPLLIKETKPAYVLSPSLIKKDDFFHMYFISLDNNKSTLKRCINRQGTFDNEHSVDVRDIPKGLNLWHVDVVCDGDILRALFVLSKDLQGNYCSLYHGESYNMGKNWSITKKVYLGECEEKFFKQIYRSSMVKTVKGSWNLYFSAFTVKQTWYTYLVEGFKIY